MRSERRELREKIRFLSSSKYADCAIYNEKNASSEIVSKAVSYLEYVYSDFPKKS